MAKQLHLKDRMWEDGFETEKDFYDKCERIIRSIAKSYLPESTTTRLGNTVRVKPHDTSTLRFSFDLESDWRSYVAGDEWGYLELSWEQALDRL